MKQRDGSLKGLTRLIKLQSNYQKERKDTINKIKMK